MEHVGRTFVARERILSIAAVVDNPLPKTAHHIILATEQVHLAALDVEEREEQYEGEGERERKEDDDRERVWLDEIVLDPRISERMRKFVLNSEDEERAKKISAEKGDPWWQSIWPKTEKKQNLWEGLEDTE